MAEISDFRPSPMKDHEVSDTPTVSDGAEEVYEVVKFVNPRDAVAALTGMAVHAERDGCMVSFHDVLTDEEITRTDIRNFVEVIVP